MACIDIEQCAILTEINNKLTYGGVTVAQSTLDNSVQWYYYFDYYLPEQITRITTLIYLVIILVSAYLIVNTVWKMIKNLTLF